MNLGAEAVTWLHAQVPAIIHNDIKSMNFLVAQHESQPRPIAKLADLELCITSGSLSPRAGEAWSPPDTVDWTAPELLSDTTQGAATSTGNGSSVIATSGRGAPRPSTASDCYALAMVIFEVYATDTPFSLQQVRAAAVPAAMPRACQASLCKEVAAGSLSRATLCAAIRNGLRPRLPEDMVPSLRCARVCGRARIPARCNGRAKKRGGERERGELATHCQVLVLTLKNIHAACKESRPRLLGNRVGLNYPQESQDCIVIVDSTCL